MLDHLHYFMGHLPFLCMTVDNKIRLNTARIVEAVIIAAIGGLMAGYIAVSKIEVRIDSLEQKVDKIIEDVYKPIFEYK